MSQQLEQVKALIELREKARLGGGEKRIDSQHQKGKYTARETATVPSTAVWYMSSHRISQYSEAPSLRPWP